MKKRIYGQTVVLIENCCFEWEIKNFSMYYRDSCEFSSPRFTAGDSSLTAWSLSMYPSGQYGVEEEDSDDEILVYLNRETNDKAARHFARFRMYVKDRNDARRHEVQFEHLFTNRDPDCGDSYTLRRRSLMSERSTLLPGDVLTVCCELKTRRLEDRVFSEIKETLSEVAQTTPDTKGPRKVASFVLTLMEPRRLAESVFSEINETLSEVQTTPDTKTSKNVSNLNFPTYSTEVLESKGSGDFKIQVQTTPDTKTSKHVSNFNFPAYPTEVLEGKGFSDFKIQAGNEIFCVHRNVLSACSVVFSQLLRVNYVEGKPIERWKISDFDPTIVRTMIRFIYSGKIPDMMSFDQAQQLYRIALQYGVEELKRTTAEFLSSHLSTDSACDLLQLGLLFGDVEMIEASHNFIYSNIAAVQDTKQWKDMSRQNPNLVIELYKNTISHSRK